MSNFSFPPPPPPPPRAALDASHVVNDQSSRGRGRGGFPRGRGPNARGRGSFGSGRGSYGTQLYGQPSSGSAYGGGPLMGQSAPSHSYNTTTGYTSASSNPPHGQKRKRGDFTESRGRGGAGHVTSAPKVSVAPAVPAFGAPLFGLTPPASVAPVQAASVKPSAVKRRKTNFLGLTPAGVDYESSSEEEKDEEAHYAVAGSALQVTHRGQTISLNSAADIKAWIEERKKRWPTKAKVEARQEEQQKRKAEQDAARQKVVEARRAEQERRRQAAESDRQAKREAEAKLAAEADAAKKLKKEQQKQDNGVQLSKEEKQRRKLEKMLAKAEKLRKKLEGGNNDDHTAAQVSSVPGPSLLHDTGEVRMEATPNYSETQALAAEPQILPHTTIENISQHSAKTDDIVSQHPLAEDAVDGVQMASAFASIQSDLSSEADSDSDSDLDSDSDSDSDLDSDLDSESLSDSDLESDVSSDSSSAPEEASAKWDRSNKLPPQHNLPQQQTKSNRVCRYFASRGSCKAGANCHFRHEMPEKREKPAERKKERKTLLQRMVEQEQAEENRLAAVAIRFLGDKGMLGVFEEVKAPEKLEEDEPAI